MKKDRQLTRRSIEMAIQTPIEKRAHESGLKQADHDQE
jgi:hypothetical protein